MPEPSRKWDCIVLPENLIALLKHRDFAMVQQGVELLLSAQEPAWVDAVVAGSQIKSDQIVVGPTIARTIRKRFQSWVALRLLIATEAVPTVQTLEDTHLLTSDGISVLSRVPGLEVVRCREGMSLSASALLQQLPDTLRRLDVRSALVTRRQLREMMAFIPSTCEVVVGDHMFWGAEEALQLMQSTHPNLQLAPFVLPQWWDGSGVDSLSVRVTLRLQRQGPDHGEFLEMIRRDDNYGVAKRRVSGQYRVDRERRRVGFTVRLQETLVGFRCKRNPCGAYPRMSFGGGMGCKMKDCGRQPGGWERERYEKRSSFAAALEGGSNRLSMDCEHFSVSQRAG